MKQYIVDAFTDKLFSGNPAAVCILNRWIPDSLMQSVAIENNLSETAFAVKEAGRYRLRWFTPGGEIDLCGHATLACAYVLMNHYDPDTSHVTFDTSGGSLSVVRSGELYELDFPAFGLKPVPVTEQIVDALGAVPKEAYLGRDLLCVFEDASAVLHLSPRQELVKKLDGLLLHATARGENADCISRSFAPKCGVAEDPVCGSGHCHIIPYWAGRLQKETLVAYQASPRGGTLYCRMQGDRVALAGKAVLYAVSDLRINHLL